jgi:oligopeptide transport system substrate-binding protein
VEPGLTGAPREGPPDHRRGTPALREGSDGVARQPPRQPSGRPGIGAFVAIAAVIALAGAIALAFAVPGQRPAQPAVGPRASGPDEARILIGAPSTLDPALHGDNASSAVIAQVFETLTAFDPSLTLRSALAESWSIEDDGRRVVFTLRDDASYSDGSPLTADDVVRSWLRLVDPAQPSPLASLILDVRGADDRLAGRVGEEAVGLRADGRNVVVEFDTPASDFPAIVAGTAFAIAPAGFDGSLGALRGDGFVGSGGYVLSSVSGNGFTLTANERYWAGRPPIKRVELIFETDGGSPVDSFAGGDADYAPIGESDASWIRYDADLGPSLREVPSLALEYLGFDTSRPPFDDVAVRQAFGMAADWRRIVPLATPEGASVATSMVPPGIPGRSDTDFLPLHEPDRARELLAAAGFPGGDGFPPVVYLSSGSAYAEGFLADIRRELGIEIEYRTMEFDPYFARLAVDPPNIFSVGWVADYPGRNDFLGILLKTGGTNNFGRWSSREFDAAIAEARSATDEAGARAAFDRAEEILRRDVPVVPLAYGSSWALARDGLLGAGQNGMGIVRMAGLGWAE